MEVVINIVPNILHTVSWVNDKPMSSLPKGSIAYYSTYGDDKAETIGLMYVCPCGCQGIGSLPFYKYDNHDPWSWNGNKEKPTLTPSILRSKTCGWHGFLTDGVFR